MSDDPILCADCEAPATRCLDLHSDYDPRCEACFLKAFVQCPRCDRWIMEDEQASMLTSHATRYDPAEYEDGCVNCLPDGPDDYNGPDTWDEARGER